MNKKWCLALAGLLLGCSSGQLDRKTAVKAIQERFSDDVSGIIMHLGRVGPHCFSLDADGHQTPADLTPDKSVETGIVIAAGYLDVKPDGPDYWRVALTERGKTAVNMERLKFGDDHNTLNGCDHRSFALALASMEIVQVTGVSSDQEKGPDIRIVDFQWRWKPTELGAPFKKYDDGWSLNAPPTKGAIP